MSPVQAAADMSYEFDVEDIFAFSDGSTVFVGLPSNSKIRLLPALARIFLDGTEVGQIQLTEHRSPGPMSPRIPLVSRDVVDVQRLRSGTCKLVCQLMSEGVATA